MHVTDEGAPMSGTITDSLQDRMTGRVLRPEEEGFAEAAAAWNLAVQHHPDFVVKAVDAADVVAAITWAGEQGLPVAVQATGHGALEAVTEGVLISTRLLQTVEIDQAARTARVGAGVRWGAVLAASVPLGLAGLCGSSSDVGVVGYSLGGGLPVLGRAFGFASDHIRSIEVVTPDGLLRTADADHEPELFEVLRGGKGGFGVVTAMTIGLVPVDEFYGGGIFFPGEDAAAVLTAFRDWAADLPEAACPSVALLRLPDMEEVPQPLRGRLVVHVRFAMLCSAEEGDRLIAPMRAAVTPIIDMVGPLPYDQIDAVFADPQEPVPFEQGGALLSAFDDAAQEALLAAAGPDVPTPLLLVEVRLLGGALGRPAPTPDVVTGRDAAWSLSCIGMLVPPIAAAVPEAVAGLLDTMRPWSTGETLANFHGQPGDRSSAWPASSSEAMARAKRRYDPTDMLRSGLAVVLPEGRPTEAALPL